MKTQKKDFEKIGKEEFGKIQGKKYSNDEMKKIVNNTGKLESMVKEGAFSRLAADVKVMMTMVRDYVSGAYRKVPVGTIMAVVGTLLYVISPVDAIPDTIPFFGLLDDAAVARLCLKFVEFDLDNYKNWAVRLLKNNSVQNGVAVV